LGPDPRCAYGVAIETSPIDRVNYVNVMGGDGVGGSGAHDTGRR